MSQSDATTTANDEILDAIFAADEAATTPSSTQGDIDVDDEESLDSSEQTELQAKIDEDEEPFDPENPTDLRTAAQKAASDEDEEEKGAISLGSQDTDESGEGDEEEDDSFINDNVEEACPDHTMCKLWAEKTDEFLSQYLKPLAGKSERRAALCEVVCDFYQRKLD